MAYSFSGIVVWHALQSGDATPPGELYIRILTAVLLLLGAHGFAMFRRSQAERLGHSPGAVRDVTTDVAMSVWEVLFGWLGVAFALIFLFNTAPANQLEEWYPRLFLCLVVFFGAMYHRALIFVFAMLPFVFTITAQALWNGYGADQSSETLARALFLAADIGVLVWAVRLARAHGVFSTSELELPLGPGSVGGNLYGVIRCPQQVAPASGYQLDLSCIRQTKEKGRRASGEILWHFRKLVRGDLPGGGEARSSVPVLFELPDAALATAGAEGARIAWTLRASAQLSESDFGCSFEVPILDSAQAALGVQESWSHDAFSGAEEPEIAIYGRREAEAMVFRFRGQWNRASEIITAAYFLFWFQMMWLATGAGLDWAVWAMFGAGLFFLGTLLAPWFSVIETRVTPAAAKVLRSSPWGRRSDSVELAEIVSVDVTGDGLRTGLLDATDYYGVNLVTRDGRKVRAAGHLREKRAAEIAASQIQTAINRALAPARPQRPAAVA
ncbi:MAG: hypothetical protein KDC27_09605 [Acidobacteria bacterium]|nr:hypothetical protein [Acidobacteriota bacterium]